MWPGPASSLGHPCQGLAEESWACCGIEPQVLMRCCYPLRKILLHLTHSGKSCKEIYTIHGIGFIIVPKKVYNVCWQSPRKLQDIAFCPVMSTPMSCHKHHLISSSIFDVWEDILPCNAKNTVVFTGTMLLKRSYYVSLEMCIASFCSSKRTYLK